MLSRAARAAARSRAGAAGVRRGLATVERIGGEGGPVVIDYEALLDRDTDLRQHIREAYGPGGLGILAIRGVSGFEEAKQRLLPLAGRFAALQDEVKAKYEDESSFYSIGWSHGKEKLEGMPDYSKGSYYANPLSNRPVDDEALIRDQPAFYGPNVWPTAEMPEMEGAFMSLGQMIVSVGADLAARCDEYVVDELSKLRVREAVVAPDSFQRLEDVIRRSRCCKGRLLNYFAPDPSTAAPSSGTDLSNWCGWHNDHGSLTGLAGGGLFFNSKGEEVPPPDDKAGLYVRSRDGSTTRVRVPPGHMAFQIGETAEVHSGGLLQATPHSVSSGGGAPGVSRASFAVFMEPEHDWHMNPPRGGAPVPPSTRPLAPGVPPLAGRWAEGQTFGDFTDATLAAYYM